jgi:hypothetical protein
MARFNRRILLLSACATTIFFSMLGHANTTINDAGDVLVKIDDDNTSTSVDTFSIQDTDTTLFSANYTGMSMRTGANNTSVTLAAAQNTAIGGNTLSYGTAVTGGMLVTGDLGVNGNIYSSNTNANSGINVANNGMSITGATNTVALISDSNATSADGRAAVNLTPTSASLTVTNNLGNSHGIDINSTRTVISGGTTSTDLTLNDNGARFSNASGGPARVTGVADASSAYDAVNYRQFTNGMERVQGGVASSAAMSNIPQVEPGKNFSMGLGYGNFISQHATALGASARLREDTVIKASLASSTEGDATVGVGASYSW